MKARSLSEVAAAIHGRLAGEDVNVSAVVIDSRNASAGSLFFAIVGEHVDGHDFIEDAVQRGASASVVSRGDGVPGPSIVVVDTVEALADLAAFDRETSTARVVGITGSSGKTSTKDLVTAVLRAGFEVQASPGSYNNEIGLPLTLLGGGPDTEVFVCEMGSRGIGHIADLCRVASPDVGIVTNVGVAHMELFGSMENIVDAKAELVESLTRNGTAILSADDPVVRSFGERTEARVLTFGRAADADVRAENLGLADSGAAHFELVHEGDRVATELSVLGEHMVSNALAAAAAGVALGIPLEDAAKALRNAHVSSWRMETFVDPGGVVVVNDAYNANPISMAAALKTARWIARDSRLAVVLGTMAELGAVSHEEHERVGELTDRLGVERVVLVGREADTIAVAAIREGVEPENVALYEDPIEALEDVRRWARRGDVVLFKGSRVVGLEKLAEAMR